MSGKRFTSVCTLCHRLDSECLCISDPAAHLAREEAERLAYEDALRAEIRAAVLAEVAEHLRIMGWTYAAAVRPGERSLLDGLLATMGGALVVHADIVAAGTLMRLAGDVVTAPDGSVERIEESAPLVRAGIEAGLQGKEAT